MRLLPDVAFDQAAARRAADECRAAAQRLRATLDLREDGLAHARRGWEGTAREDADRVTAILRSDGEELHQRLLDTAARIERAMEEAAAEQRRREAENARRREEHRRAQLAEHERREEAARQRTAGGSRPAGSPR
jgi:hypothetical protein